MANTRQSSKKALKQFTSSLSYSAAHSFTDTPSLYTLRIHTLLRCTIGCPMLLFVLRQIALKPRSLHLRALHMWYFPRIDGICQSMLHWEKNHYIYITLFWGTRILFSLSVPLYYLTVNIYKECQHSKTASIFGNNLCKVSLFQNILISLFLCTEWLLSRKKKMKLEEVFCIIIMKSNCCFREIWEQYI